MMRTFILGTSAAPAAPVSLRKASRRACMSAKRRKLRAAGPSPGLVPGGGSPSTWYTGTEFGTMVFCVWSLAMSCAAVRASVELGMRSISVSLEARPSRYRRTTLSRVVPTTDTSLTASPAGVRRPATSARASSTSRYTKVTLDAAFSPMPMVSGSWLASTTRKAGTFPRSSTMLSSRELSARAKSATVTSSCGAAATPLPLRKRPPTLERMSRDWGVCVTPMAIAE
mmetsp:Transcript_16756/g.56284  ORF Transcript_16756/g.56284 Transcript_16756/m.56284 type:complete len:227 (+) Transcript_16756:461-1141(+)